MPKQKVVLNLNLVKNQFGGEYPSPFMDHQPTSKEQLVNSALKIQEEYVGKHSPEGSKSIFPVSSFLEEEMIPSFRT